MLSGGEKREKQSEREERTESRLQAHALVIFLSSPSPQRERRRRWWFFVFVFSSLEGISFFKEARHSSHQRAVSAHASGVPSVGSPGRR